MTKNEKLLVHLDSFYLQPKFIFSLEETKQFLQVIPSLTVRTFLKIRQHSRNKNPFSDYLQGQQKSSRLIPHVPFSDGRPDHANRSGDGWSFSDRQTRQAG